MCALVSSHYHNESEALFNRDSAFIAAAHELKAPLALVRQLSLLMTGDDNNIDDASRQEYIRQIRLSSEKALRLTSDLTKTARLEDAMFDLEPINPFQLCREVAEEMQPLTEAHSRTIKVFGKRKKPPLIIANKDLLKRVVVNFTDNALNYGNNSTPIELRVGSIKKGNAVRLAVRDYGPALRRDLKKSIKKNKLEANRINGRPNSSGLGIYLASKFAESMNANIGAISHRDGATFYIDLHTSNQLSLL